jgi:hypothetical protein
VCIKDFNPEWYVASRTMVDIVSAATMVQALIQSEGESPQSEQQES